MKNYKNIYGGIPFLHSEFDENKLMSLVAVLRRKFCEKKKPLREYLSPETAQDVYFQKHGNNLIKDSIPLSEEKRERVEQALTDIKNEINDWNKIFNLPIEFRSLGQGGDVSVSNPFIPQLIYLGDSSFHNQHKLKEILVHEYSHVYAGIMCEILDFQKVGTKTDLYLPSGTGPRDLRGLILAGLFAASAINYYKLSGSIVKFKKRVEFLFSYLVDTTTLISHNHYNLTEFGKEVLFDMIDFRKNYDPEGVLI